LGKVGPVNKVEATIDTMTSRKAVASAVSPPRGVARYRDRTFDDKRHDPYQPKGKYAEPSACGICGAVFHRGHWQWGHAADGATRVICPACQRTRDKLPAGSLTLGGSFFEAHRDEVLALVGHVAKRERQEHPLNRVMDIESGTDQAILTTTDIHLPQRIAEALHHSFQGDFELDYGPDEYVVHAKWRR
jgi:hypothetical protein